MKFQTILLAFFGVMAVVGLIAFSKSDPEKDDSPIAEAKGTVVIWGTYPDLGMGGVIEKFNQVYAASFNVIYQYHDPKTFDSDIVEALASGRGPDVLLLPDDLILRHSDKIDIFPYAALPPGVFSEMFIQAAEIYMRDTGFVALPFALDPIVMYWNRDLFNNESITQPPKYWDELLVMVPKLTKRDKKTSEIKQSGVAFGEFSNVDHAKDILAMLFLQVGNPIVKMKNGHPASAIAVSADGFTYVPDENMVSAFRFYMDFSNPLKNIYTWTRSKSGSLNEFINGNLAIHFDYASSYKKIQEKNPYLNFAVAQVPLPRGTTVEVTYGKVHGFAVLKTSQNKKTAFIAIQRLLFDKDPSANFASAFNLPPVRRDMLNQKPSDAALSVFYDAAIRSHSWLDPKPELSDIAFREAVEGVSSGKTTVSVALAQLNAKLLVPLASY